MHISFSLKTPTREILFATFSRKKK